MIAITTSNSMSVKPRATKKQLPRLWNTPLFALRADTGSFSFPSFLPLCRGTIEEFNQGRPETQFAIAKQVF